MSKILFCALGPKVVVQFDGKVYEDSDDLNCDEALANLLIGMRLAVSYTDELKYKFVKLKESADKKRQQVKIKMEKYKRGDAK